MLVIQNYLNYSKVYITSTQIGGGYQLRIVNDSYNPIILNKILFEFDDSHNTNITYNKEFKSSDLDLNFKMLFTKNKLFIEGSGKIKKMIFINSINNREINQKDIYLNYSMPVKYYNKTESIKTIDDNKIKYSISNDTINVYQGMYTIKENLIFP